MFWSSTLLNSRTLVKPLSVVLGILSIQFKKEEEEGE